MATLGDAVCSLAAPAVTACGKGVGNWLRRKYRYVKHINRNLQKLEKAKQSLTDKRSDVQTELDNNSSKMKQTEECRTWLRDVASKIQEIEEVEYEYRNRPSTCLCGLYPFCALHKLGKRIVKKTSEAISLKDELSRITTMRDRPASISRSRRWKDDVRVVNIPSLENNVATLLEWLQDEEVKRMCIWGPPGVGKTTIMKTVLDRMSRFCNFKYTFVVTVTAGTTAENIQEVIMKELGINTKAEMSKKLNEEKYLLFLDGDVSSAVSLEAAGIHHNHTQGKVVFACRDKYDGHTDQDLNVRKLSYKDARKLFWEVVGLKENRKLKETAELIIHLCGGMPSVLVLVGKQLAMKNDLALWHNKKLQLQSPSKQLWEDLEDYYRSFKLVYDELSTDDDKSCLLYWAIFPFGEEINRDHIIDCWATEQFLKCQRLWQARDRGHAILDKFTDKSLLEKGEKFGHFKMFVFFQQAALRIAKEENGNVFVENNKNMEDHKWIRARRVSLARMCLPPLPQKPQCTGMLTLLLHENNLTEFPREFFEGMPDLRVLCLWETRIVGLPSSISKLKNLKGLFLDNCSQLVQLPHQIGDLLGLQILVVRHAGIYSLPSEIGRLGNLKCLRISFKETANQTVNSGNCNRKKTEETTIPGEIIEKLSKLEELSIDVSPNIRTWNENAYVIARKITKLKELTHLHFYFPQMGSFEYFIRGSEPCKANGKSRKLEGFRSFNIFVGPQGNSSASEFNVFECSAEKHLKFSGGVGFPAVVSEVLEQANSFELIGHTTARSLTDNLSADALQELEAFIVEECDAMQSIVNGNTNTTGSVVFQCLKKLHIRKLPNLVSIWQGTIASESFRALTTLTLKECQGITILFSLEMVSQLPELQNLQVVDCKKIKKIIDSESTVQSTNFPKLKSFQLCSLPSLSSICGASLKWPSLETILIKKCDELKSLPHILENASKLSEIHCAETWWNQQAWPEPGTKERFRTLRRDPS